MRISLRVAAAALVGLVLAVHPAPAGADPALVHGELDPLTFSTGAYGGQIGIRAPALHGVRLAIASFALNVPDPIAQLGGNDGFHLKVRPSGAVYALYYLAPPGHDGFAFGGSVRYLRLRYTHDATPGAADVREISPEAIVAYQWHPFHGGFYLQPWLALGVAVWHGERAVVGRYTYDELPVSPFFTVNIGYEHAFGE